MSFKKRALELLKRKYPDYNWVMASLKECLWTWDLMNPKQRADVFDFVSDRKILDIVTINVFNQKSKDMTQEEKAAVCQAMIQYLGN